MPGTTVSSRCPRKTCRCVVRHRLSSEQRRQLMRSLGCVLECPSCRNPISIRLHDDGSFQGTLITPLNHPAELVGCSRIGVDDVAEQPSSPRLDFAPNSHAVPSTQDAVTALPPFDPIAANQADDAQGRISRGLSSFSSIPKWIQIAVIVAILSIAVMVIWPAAPAKKMDEHAQQPTGQSISSSVEVSVSSTPEDELTPDGQTQSATKE